MLLRARGSVGSWLELFRRGRQGGYSSRQSAIMSSSGDAEENISSRPPQPELGVTTPSLVAQQAQQHLEQNIRYLLRPRPNLVQVRGLSALVHSFIVLIFELGFQDKEKLKRRGRQKVCSSG